MATGTTDAIPTYGEVTGYTADYIKTGTGTSTYHYTDFPFLRDLSINYVSYEGWTSNVVKTLDPNITLYELKANAKGDINSFTLYLLNTANTTAVTAFYPQFIVFTNSKPLLATSSSTATIKVCGSTTATTFGTTTICGPIGSSQLLYYNRSTNKYIPL